MGKVSEVREIWNKLEKVQAKRREERCKAEVKNKLISKMMDIMIEHPLSFNSMYQLGKIWQIRWNDVIEEIKKIDDGREKDDE